MLFQEEKVYKRKKYEKKAYKVMRVKELSTLLANKRKIIERKSIQDKGLRIIRYA